MIEQFQKGEKVKLSENFNSSEWDCHCSNPDCTITYIDLDLIEMLQVKRDEWKDPIHIVSGFRCVQHNHEIGGKKGSMHLVGKAADIKVNGMHSDKVAALCENFGGLGRYSTWTHVDNRNGHSRWQG